MALEPAVATVSAAYQAASERERDRVIAYLERLWLGLPDYYDATMSRFVATIVPAMEGAQRQAAVATDAYLARVESLTLGRATQPVGVALDVSTTEAMRGVAAEEVWHRPAKEVYRSLDQGLDVVGAGQRGLARARSLATTNLELAHTHAARHCLNRRDTVVGYRRVTRGGVSCALCLIAATQRYRKQNLMPIHPGCHCKVHAIHAGHDPGQTLNDAQLTAVRDKVATFTGGDGRVTSEDYKQMLIVHEHGEIGPVLGVRGQSYTVPSELKPGKP